MTTEEELNHILSPQLQEVLELVANSDSYRITIPDPKYIDLSIADLQSLVASTSNLYGRLSRFSGIANAEAKLAKARFERRFKSSRLGKNEAERVANAMQSAEVEHEHMSTAEAIASVADALESAARIASESARRLLSSVLNQYDASGRG